MTTAIPVPPPGTVPDPETGWPAEILAARGTTLWVRPWQSPGFASVYTLRADRGQVQRLTGPPEEVPDA